jgi:Xaa-Pro aminopeptidase
MGTLVVTVDDAALFADSRYWVQAEAELAGTGMRLEKIPTGNCPPRTSTGWPPRCPPAAWWRWTARCWAWPPRRPCRRRWTRPACAAHRHRPAGAVWPERPALPVQPVYEHRAPHAATPRAAKLARVREAMARHGATHHFVSTVDDIAWITNLRGSDVEYNPVFLAHLLVDLTGATLFVGDGKVDAALRPRCLADGVQLAAYAQAGGRWPRCRPGSVLLVDPGASPSGLRQAVPPGVKVVEAINPSTLAKSRKTAAEAVRARGHGRGRRRDVRVLCRFEASMARGERWTELTIDERLARARAAPASWG